MKTKRIVAFIVIVVAAGAAYAGWSWYNAKRVEQAAAEATPTIQTVQPRSGTVTVAVEVPAVAEAFRTSRIRSAVSGTVAEAVDVGAQIGAGQVVARLDATEAQRAVTRAQIALDESRVNRTRAADAAERAVTAQADAAALVEVGAIPREQVTAANEAARNAQYALELAELAVQRAELTLAEARDTVRRMEVRAPHAGVVLSSAVQPGDPVAGNNELLVIADLSRLRFWGEVDEFDIGLIQPRMSVTLAADSLEEPLSTRLESISPVAEIVNSISVFRVSAVVDNPDGTLRAGMTADLSVVVARDRGLTVPSRAVSTVRGRSYVDVLVADGSVETRRVEIGANDGTNVVVLSGLETEDLVVIPAAATPAFGLPAAAPATNGGSSLIPIPMPGAGGGTR